MYLNKKQYKALSVAIAVMDAYISNGGRDENNEVSDSLDELVKMSNKVNRAKENEHDGE